MIAKLLKGNINKIVIIQVLLVGVVSNNIYKQKRTYIIRMLKIILLLFCLSTSVAYHGTPVVWNKIIQFPVNIRVSQFLNDKGINNCFEYEEDQDNLYLKCWTDNELINVDIKIYNNDEVAYI